MPEIEIKYSYKDASTIKKFSESNAFIRGLLGPFGSGKSSGCVIEILRRSQMQPPGKDGIRRSRWAIVRNSYPQLRDTTIRTVHQWLPPHLFGRWRAADHDYIIEALPGVHLELMFRALDRPDQIGNLLSLELTSAWVNEAREVPWSIINAIEGRIGRYPAQREVEKPFWYGVIMDSNPPDSDSKFYKFFEETDHTTENEDIALKSNSLWPRYSEIFKQPSGLSPNAENLNNLPGGRQYYENLARGKDPEFVKVYVHGEYGFVIDGRPVFATYSDSMHCREFSINPMLPIYRGWDFGLTPACAFIQMSPKGQFQIFDELTTEDMGIDEFSEEVLQHCSQHFPDAEFLDFGDPAGAQKAQTDARTCFDILRAKNIDILPGLQSLSIRMESMRKPLGVMRKDTLGFALHPRCKTLRKAFQGGYHFRKLQTSDERYTAVPNKNFYSHIMDAACYVATEIFGRGLTIPKPRPGFEDESPEFDYMPGSGTRSPVTGY